MTTVDDLGDVGIGEELAGVGVVDVPVEVGVGVGGEVVVDERAEVGVVGGGEVADGSVLEILCVAVTIGLFVVTE